MSHNRISSNREVRRALDYAFEKGFELLRTAGGHIVIRNPIINKTLTFAASPSCPRAWRNMIRDVDRAIGLKASPTG